MDEKVIIKNIFELYEKYGVDKLFLEELSDERKIKGMKGVLAELDLKKNRNYDEIDLYFIQKIYSMYC